MKKTQDLVVYNECKDWHGRCVQLVEAALRSDLNVARLCLDHLGARLEQANPSKEK